MPFSTWDEYLNCIAQPTVWGTEIELGSFSDMLNAPIVLFTEEENPKVYHPKAPGEPLFISHVQENHFISCVPFKGLNKREIFHAIVKDLIVQNEKMLQ